MITKDQLPVCPVATAVYFLGNKWTLLIIRELVVYKTIRFGQLKKI